MICIVKVIILIKFSCYINCFWGFPFLLVFTRLQVLYCLACSPVKIESEKPIIDNVFFKYAQLFAVNYVNAPQLTAQLGTCKATRPHLKDTQLGHPYLDGPTCRATGKKYNKKYRIKAAAGRRGSNTQAFYTSGCNYITAQIFLCATGSRHTSHQHTHSHTHVAYN